MTKEHITKEYYEMSTNAQKQYIRMTRNRIKHSHDLILIKMMDFVTRHVRDNHADFYVHDVSLYKFNEGEPFFWIVRDKGTHYIDLMSEQIKDNDVWLPREQLYSILFHCGKEIKGIHIVENGKMRKITEQSARAILGIKECYVRSILLEDAN